MRNATGSIRDGNSKLARKSARSKYARSARDKSMRLKKKENALGALRLSGKTSFNFLNLLNERTLLFFFEIDIIP